ncbi:L,D-transpeptidase family protein [Pseudooceanicola sp. C21-150M6]|uniref:L,D-transpeptidase family protein n=1 Tax=Pseudooceanicola sp. C21-150M6 TaxID=3434355 RepID=UPI003D7F978A
MRLTARGLAFAGRTLPCTIGRGGLSATKREGDGATPIGRHRIVGCLFRPDRVTRPAPWALPILPGMLWSDDARDPAYNQLVHAPYGPSHEKLRRADPLYDIILLTDWNWPEAVPGAGSAIFLHQWRRPGYPTEGCLAFARPDIRWIAEQAVPGTVLQIG